ncbi:hypothetical protein H2200_011339 [Cladophialophora chaetospira]|uniref:Uncharacterized protein n=1 Tax=Cladophialophora chaetospira TaxID=386627 RepID=A0AA38X0F4_9EURO|nr:hypothetical protein H2200_011339 [Cladophialophora chaetospira]
MDQLARQYRARYQEALNHALEGNPETALDICWELRLEPRVGVYRRALVNLLIAKTLPSYRESEKLTYAEECLDLIDILRQDNGGTLDDDVKNIQSIAEDFIEEWQQKQVQASTGSIVQDPATGMLTSDPVAPTDAAGKAESTVGEGNGMDVDSDDMTVKSKVAGGDDNADGKGATQEQNKRKIICVYRTNRDDKKDDVPVDDNNSVTIEGMLRDNTYAPRVKKAETASSDVHMGSPVATKMVVLSKAKVADGSAYMSPAPSSEL